MPPPILHQRRLLGTANRRLSTAIESIETADSPWVGCLFDQPQSGAFFSKVRVRSEVPLVVIHQRPSHHSITAYRLPARVRVRQPHWRSKSATERRLGARCQPWPPPVGHPERAPQNQAAPASGLAPDSALRTFPPSNEPVGGCDMPLPHHSGRRAPPDKRPISPSAEPLHNSRTRAAAATLGWGQSRAGLAAEAPANAERRSCYALAESRASLT